MGRGGLFGDASGHRVNHDLSPFDIQAGGNPRVIWQGPGYGSGEDMGGGEEGVATDTGTSKDDQVPLGHPLCSGHLNVGVSGIGRECGVAGVDQNWRRKSCLGVQGRHERVMCEAEHKAGPGRRGRVLSLDLGPGGFGAKGRVRGAWSGRRFRGDFSKGRLLTTPRLGDARSSPAPSVVAYGGTRRRSGLPTLFLASRLRHKGRGNQLDRGGGGGREWGGGDRGRRQISGHLRKCSGSHLALFQGAWCWSANVRGSVIRDFTRCHNGVFIRKKGGGEEWVRKTGGGRDFNWKSDRADCSGEGGGCDKLHETINDRVKAMGFDSCDIRGRGHPKGHGGRQKRLEGSGEGKLGDRAQEHVDITFVNAVCRDERRDRFRVRSEGKAWVLIAAPYKERLPANL